MSRADKKTTKRHSQINNLDRYFPKKTITNHKVDSSQNTFESLLTSIVETKSSQQNFAKNVCSTSTIKSETEPTSDSVLFQQAIHENSAVKSKGSGENVLSSEGFFEVIDHPEKILIEEELLQSQNISKQSATQLSSSIKFPHQHISNMMYNDLRKSSSFSEPLSLNTPHFLKPTPLSNNENITGAALTSFEERINFEFAQQKEKIESVKRHEFWTCESELLNSTNYCENSQVTDVKKEKEELTSSKKKSNIPADSILFEDNLLKTFLEKKGTFSEATVQLNKKTDISVIASSGPYSKRYIKGDMRIYKLKPRIKKIKGSNNQKNRPMTEFLSKYYEENNSTDSSEESSDYGFVSTPTSYKTDESKSEVLSTGSNKLTEPDQLLRQGINKLSKDKSLLFSKLDDPVPRDVNKQDIISSINVVIRAVLDDYQNGRIPCFEIPREDIKNCEFLDGRYQLKKYPDIVKVSYGKQHSRNKFNLMLYLLQEIKKLLETNTTLTKRELYYQLKTFIVKQSTTDNALKNISRILNVGLWDLNILAQKGIVYGNLKIVMFDGECINCNVRGTCIPQNVSKISEIHSTAYFILVVEKETIFYKLLEENLPNKLTRPFILITGKGFPDLNTQLFLKKLWMIMRIPVFILVDADPDGISIMMTYRFGSIANVHLSEYLAIPKAKWMGVFPSEISKFSFATEQLSQREINKTKKMLQQNCFDEHEDLKKQLEILLEKGVKCGIESLLKSDEFLSNFYLSLKLYSNDLI